MFVTGLLRDFPILTLSSIVEMCGIPLQPAAPAAAATACSPGFEGAEKRLELDFFAAASRSRGALTEFAVFAGLAATPAPGV